MPLSNERIQELLAKKNAPRQSKPRTTGIGGKKVNVNDRSYQSWFALEHHLIASDGKSMTFCENPDCLDPRDKTYGQTVVIVDGKNVCRFCFVNGWLAKNEAQSQLTTA